MKWIDWVIVGDVGSGVVVKLFWTNPRRWVIRFDGVMVQTSVLLLRMQVRVGDSRPAVRLVNIPLQWGSPCAILYMYFGWESSWVGIAMSRIILTWEH